MKIIGTFSEVSHLLAGGDARGPFVTPTNVSAIGCIPAPEPQYRIVTSSTPEARKPGCLEIFKMGSFQIEKTSYMLVMYEAEIPRNLIELDISAIGHRLFGSAVGDLYLSALVNREPLAKVGLLIDFKKKGWKLFSPDMDVITDFSISKKGRIAVIADGCAGFITADDLVDEFVMRSGAGKKLIAFTLPPKARVRVPDGSMLTRYVRPHVVNDDTFAVYRNGKVSFYNASGRSMGHLPEEGAGVPMSPFPVMSDMLLTDTAGNEHRLEVVEVEESGEVLIPRRETRAPRPSGRKKSVRRIRSQAAEADTITPTIPH
jgi:hypothetical protein